MQRGCEGGKKGKRRLKYHEDIIRYRRVVYPYRHPPYDRIKQPSILIHDGGTRQRDAKRIGRKSRRAVEIRKIAL